MTENSSIPTKGKQDTPKEPTLDNLFGNKISKYNFLKNKFIKKWIKNLKDNKVSKDEIPLIEKEIINSPTILSDLPILIALFSVTVTFASNLSVPYISSLISSLIKKYSFEKEQVLDNRINSLQTIEYYVSIVLIITLCIVICKVVINIRKKWQLSALYTYERSLLKKDNDKIS